MVFTEELGPGVRQAASSGVRADRRRRRHPRRTTTCTWPTTRPRTSPRRTRSAGAPSASDGRSRCTSRSSSGDDVDFEVADLDRGSARLSASGCHRGATAVTAPTKVAHLTTVDSSLRFLLFPQLRARRRTPAARRSASARPGRTSPDSEARRDPAPRAARRRPAAWSLSADLRAACELWRILRRERLDVLHTHNPKPGLYGRVVGRLAGVPDRRQHRPRALRRPTDDRVAEARRRATRSRRSRRGSPMPSSCRTPRTSTCMRRWRISPPPARPGCSATASTSRGSTPPGRAPTSARRSARELGVGPDDVVVGSVGRLVAEKGYPELFEAARHARPAARPRRASGPTIPRRPTRLPAALGRGGTADAACASSGIRDDVDALYAAHGRVRAPVAS